MTYYEYLAKCGGMVNCGDHLGVFIGTDIKGCPLGWIFIPLKEATPELVAEAVSLAKEGRPSWPKKETFR